MLRCIDRSQARERAELVFDENGVHADALLALELDRAERVENVERAPEAAGAPGDALPPDAQVGRIRGESYRGTIQAMPGVKGILIHIRTLQVPVLR